MPIKKIGSLEIESEAKNINTKFVIIQKICIFLMFLIVIAAVLGLFGKGFFSSISKNQGNLTISYDQFIRNQASTIYHIEINLKHNDKLIKFWISPSFYKKLSIKSIMPTPEIVGFSNDKIIYSFNNVDTNTINITIVAEPEDFGFISTNIGLLSGETIKLNQFIYP